MTVWESKVSPAELLLIILIVAMWVKWFNQSTALPCHAYNKNSWLIEKIHEEHQKDVVCYIASMRNIRSFSRIPYTTKNLWWCKQTQIGGLNCIPIFNHRLKVAVSHQTTLYAFFQQIMGAWFYQWWTVLSIGSFEASYFAG